MPKKNAGKSTPKNKSTKPKTNKRGGKKNNFKKAVQKIINENAESKQAYHKLTSDESLLMFNSTINTAGDMCQVIPSINRGTADNERIGDQIRPQYLNISGHMRYNPSSAVNDNGRGNIAVRLMVLSEKIRPSYATVKDSVSPLSSLLKKGGTTTSYGGYLSDIYAPVNTDLFTVHYNKVFYLNQPMMIQPATGSLTSGFQNLQNIVKFFNIKIKLTKNLKYDASVGADNTPTNQGPFLCLGYTYLNGASPDTTSTNVGLYYGSELVYQDS